MQTAPTVTTTTHNNMPATLQQQPAPRVPWGQRIRTSLRARWPGYPLIAILIAVSFVVGTSIQGRQRYFVERDPNLSYPYRTDTVPSWSLSIIGAIGPLFVIIVTQVLIRRSPSAMYFDRRTKDIHLVIIVLGEVLSVTWLITNLLKAYVGRLRPDFFAYCNYKGYRNAAEGDMTDYLANTIPGRRGDTMYCTEDTLDNHFSFPSGHASISFCGLTFLTLFLLHATSRINFRHHAAGKAIRFFMILIPIFSAAFVAATRVIDYRHNVEDIIWGSIIGMAGAFIAFHANYGYTWPVGVPGIPVVGGVYINSNNTYFPPHESELNSIAVPTTAENSHTKINASSPLVTRNIPNNSYNV